MKKIIASIVIASTLFISSISLCMFARTKQLLKATPWKQQKRCFIALPTLAENCYRDLCKNIEKNEEKLRLLRQDPVSNLREIWRLEDSIKKNRRTLRTFRIDRKPSFDKTTE